MEHDRIYHIENPELDGLIPIRSEITVLSADDCKSLKLGWVIEEHIGNAYFTKSGSWWRRWWKCLCNPRQWRANKLVRSTIIE